MTACPSEEQFRSFLDGTLPAAEDAALEGHVAECRNCEARLNALVCGGEAIRWRSALRDGREMAAADGARSHAADRDSDVPDSTTVPKSDTDVRADDPSAVRAASALSLLEQVETLHDLEEIGRGSFGIVFRARTHLHAEAAVKILRPELAANANEVERVEREARAAASVVHDNVVRIHNVEKTARPAVPYIIMEYMRGESLHQRLQREGKLGPRAAAEIARQVAAGLQAAHQRELVHRDIKPRNILLESETGHVKLTDFGLACPNQETISRPSEGGDIVGTAHYMSPEQVRTPRHVNQRSDLYSLGVVLFEMLTGRRPFQGEGHGLLMQVAHDEPPTPRKVNPAVPVDLDAIVQRCMAKLPRWRYRSAADVAEDLRRYLDHQPIEARAVGRVERTVLWCAREPWQAVATAVVLVAAIVFGIAGAIVADQQSQQRQSAERERDEVQRLWHKTEVLQTKFQLQAAKLALANNDHAAASKALQFVVPRIDSWDVRWMTRLAQPPLKLRAPLVDGDWWVLGAALSPDDRRLAVTDGGGLLTVWDLDKRRVTARLKTGRWLEDYLRWAHHFEAREATQPFLAMGRCPTAICWLPGGSSLAFASLDGTVWWWNTETGKAEQKLKVDEPLYDISLSSDGTRLLAGGAGGGLYLLNARGETIQKNTAGESAVSAIAAVPDSAHWLVGREDGRVEWYGGDLAAARPLQESGGPVWDIDCQVDDTGLRVAIAGGTSRIDLCQLSGEDAKLAPLQTLRSASDGDTAVFQQIAMSRDGKHLYAGDSQRRVTCWDLAEGKPLWTNAVSGTHDLREQLLGLIRERGQGDQFPLPFQRLVSFVAERPQESQLVTAGDDTAVKTWELDVSGGSAARVLGTAAGPSPSVAFGPEPGGPLWTLSQEGQLRLIDAVDDRLLAEVKAHRGGAAALARVGGSAVMATAGGDETLRFWKSEGGKLRPQHEGRLRHDAGLISVASSPDGRWIAAVDEVARLVVWDFQSGRQVFLTGLSGDGQPTTKGAMARPLTGRVAFNRTATRLAAFGTFQSAPLFETNPFRRTSEQIALAGSGGTALLWSPVHDDVVFAADDHPRYTSRVLGPSGHDLKGFSEGPKSTCTAMFATSDHRRVVTVERDGRIILLDSEHMIQMLELNSQLKDLSAAAIDGEGRILAVAARDGRLESWNAGVETRAQLPKPEDAVSRWDAGWLVKPYANTIQTDHRMVRVDGQGRVGVLYTESTATSYRSDGTLYYAVEQGRSAEREKLELTQSEFDQRATAEAAGLWYGIGDEAWAAVRLRTAKRTNHDGTIYIAHRAGKNHWTATRVHDTVNMGFSPFLRLDERGQPCELLHFSHAGNYLVSATPGSSDSDEWDLRYVGRQGDGFRLTAAEDTAGNVHLVFKPNRFNNDPARVVYARWDGKQLHRELIDPLREISVQHVAFLPDGAPVVLQGSTLIRKDQNGWKEYTKLPIPPSRDFAISKRGEVSFVEWDADDRRFVIWTGVGGKWSGKAVAGAFEEGSPNWWTIRLDARDRPLVVFGKTGEPYGWLRVLRQKE